MSIKPTTLAVLQNLDLPVIASPMFLISNPKMVIEACKAGVVGSFPTLNQRENVGFDQWLTEIKSALDTERNQGKNPAPFAVNLVVHKTNKRLEQDLKTIVKHQVPIVITSLGINQAVIDAVHSYGGLVFHDVIQTRHAIKAVAGGVDGLILVCAGAGGHAGTLNPFAFVGEVRKFYKGVVILAGCISTGADIAAAKAMGADFAYMGTRFIATQEANALDGYKQMVVESHSSDIMYTPNISGIHANFLTPSIVNSGIDPNKLTKPEKIDLGDELTVKEDNNGDKSDGAWKTIWSAGQGVGSIDKVLPIAKLVAELKAEYVQAKSNL
ncbi:MAG: nitronate monooxygenase [Gammaproteobacteria bacterium]|nr:MAG: nitronate monooxygenase [Gammaproteobacteria bacterium]